MTQPSDDLTLQIEKIRLDRRRLAGSVDASGIALHRALHGRPRRKAAVRYRVGVVLLVSAVVFLAVLTLQRRPDPSRQAGVPSGGSEAASVSAVSSQAAPTVAQATLREPFTVHVRATRSCRVRVVVDGVVLDWRSLQEGDEFLARPRQEMVIESTDGGALAATVDGEPVILGADGHDVALRITSDGLFPYDRR